MPKFTKKLVVYLDQNFISEMAKAATNPRVSPLFTSIYNLLHQGFLEEKTAVPSSWFHDIESSFAPDLKGRINDLLAHMGQIDLQYPDTISRFQFHRAIKVFQGAADQIIDIKDAYESDPDKRAEPFKINVNMNLAKLFSLGSREKLAADIDNLKQSISSERISFAEQTSREKDIHIKHIIKSEIDGLKYGFHKDPESVTKFFNSDILKNLPHVVIHSSMWSKLLVDNPGRPIGRGDQADIDMISTFLPYVDVLATDTFMAEIVGQLGLDQKYGTTVYGANQKSLGEMETYINNYLINNEPAHKPVVSIFVHSDQKIKENSFEFFKNLTQQAKRYESRRGWWVKVHAFDNGNMPKYIMRANPKIVMPFYGLQFDVDTIKISSLATSEELVSLSRANSKSEKFILIDKYTELPDDFILGLIKATIAGDDNFIDHEIHSR